MDNLAQDGDESYGGAIYCELGSRPKISNSLFLRNRVSASHGNGGAIWSRNGGPVAINCNFISNRAKRGGAIASNSGSSKYINCIFWDNHRVTKGDDIANGGRITLQNCSFKCGLNWPCIYNNGTLIDGGGNTSGNPAFVDFANGNYHLLYNSPCVDAGTNEVTDDLPATDLSGEERIVDGNGDGIPTVDIGAYEFQEPNEPYILLSSHEFEVIYLGTDHSFEPQVLSIRKVGIQDLYWEISEECSWLDITPTQGNIVTGEVNDVTLTVDTAGLSNGNYSCELTVLGTNAGNSPQTVHVSLYICPIQKLIDAADDGDTIVITPGTYKGKYNRDIDFKGKKIAIQSMEPNCPAVVASTIIDCNGTEADPHRAFWFHSGEDANSILNGLTIKNGYAYNGGGIYCNSSSPTIINCNFVDCSAEDWGGGIYCYKSSPLISRSTFTRNSAREGAAVSTYSYWDYLCSPRIENCHIFDNTASDSGGGINSDCLSTPIISNCLITGNFAGTYGGGGISIFQSNPTITGCTIVDNSTESAGCGILQWYEFENGSTVRNCIIWGNTFASGPEPPEAGPSGPQITLGSQMTISYCDIEGIWVETLPGAVVNWGGGIVDWPPVFVDPINGDYHLSGDSMCINRGDPSYIPALDETDIDGQARVMLGQVDIGADEFTLNHTPVACIVGGNKITCTERVTLDGSCSSDSDSAPGTKDDIACFAWFRIDPCDPQFADFIGCGEIIDCNLPAGENIVVLEVVDKAGAFDSSEVTIIVLYPVEVIIPPRNAALQDNVTLTAEISCMGDVNAVSFYVREPNDGNGIPIGYEDLPATPNGSSGRWEHELNTTQLDDGYYVVLAKAVDTNGREVWSELIPFSIRNWAVINLLPVPRYYRAGRTVPIKFALRIDGAVDPAMPFVYSEELEIRIFDAADPENILQSSLYGDTSKDYRIDSVAELYITNFKTAKTPAVYEVEIWRTVTDFLIGGFSFSTEILGRGDLTADGNTNFDDLYIMAENWLADGEIADISPYPDGDGIVDFRDFALLAEGWLEVISQ